MCVHTLRGEFQCQARGCKYTAKTRTSHKLHVLMHEEDPAEQFPFACPILGCDYRRRLNAGIETHLDVHSKSKVHFKCKLCPERCFPDSKSLRFHNLVTHSNSIPSGIKSYKCSGVFTVRGKFSFAAALEKSYVIYHVDICNRKKSVGDKLTEADVVVPSLCITCEVWHSVCERAFVSTSSLFEALRPTQGNSCSFPTNSTLSNTSRLLIG